MAVDVHDMNAADQLVSEEMTQYFATVDGQTGTYVLGDQRAYSVRAPHVDRNRIFGVHLTAETADEGVERLLEPFRRAVVPVTWYVDPCSAPRDLATRLAGHGLELRYSLTGMVKGLANGRGEENQEPPPGTVVIEARSAKERHEWMRVVLQGFGLSEFRDMESVLTDTGVTSGRWRRLMALENGTPAGGVLLFAGDGVAGLHWLGVPGSFRSHGIGALLSREAVRLAAEAGYDALALQANPEVVALYLRMGFQKAGEIAVFDWRPGIGVVTVEPD
ncbi:MAG: GNAT family N-acetyltransferase [Candidatus Cryosericum sp.]|nr:GNAT family N-acetyltransferase [Candidatus Cryosericum sp.]